MCVRVCVYVNQNQFAKHPFFWLECDKRQHHSLWACGSMHFQNQEHHLHHQGTNMSVFLVCHHLQYIATEGGRLVRGWVLVNWAVKISNVSGLFKRQNGSRAEATAKTQEECRDVRRCEIIHYCMLSYQENVFKCVFITIWNNLAVMGTNYLVCVILSHMILLILLSLTP